MRKIHVALVAAAAFCFAMLGFAGSALAQSPYLWNDYSGSDTIYALPNSDDPGVTTTTEPNGTDFTMKCWTDNDNQRWFYGQTPDGGWWYAQAVYVGSQATVPAC